MMLFVIAQGRKDPLGAVPLRKKDFPFGPKFFKRHIEHICALFNPISSTSHRMVKT